jgi:hypothetical protein
MLAHGWALASTNAFAIRSLASAEVFHSFSEIEILDSFQQNYAFRFRLALLYFSCNLLAVAGASLFDLPVFRFRTTLLGRGARVSAPNLRVLR